MLKTGQHSLCWYAANTSWSSNAGYDKTSMSNQVLLNAVRTRLHTTRCWNVIAPSSCQSWWLWPWCCQTFNDTTPVWRMHDTTNQLQQKKAICLACPCRFSHAHPFLMITAIHLSLHLKQEARAYVIYISLKLWKLWHNNDISINNASCVHPLHICFLFSFTNTSIWVHPLTTLP